MEEIRKRKTEKRIDNTENISDKNDKKSSKIIIPNPFQLQHLAD